MAIDPADMVCSLSLEDLAALDWTDANNDDVPQIGEVKFDGESLDAELDEDAELFECFKVQHDAWKNLMAGKLAPVATPPLQSDGGAGAQPAAVPPPRDGGVTDAAVSAAPAPAKHKGATIEFAKGAKIPEPVRQYIEGYFAGINWSPANRVHVSTASLDSGATAGLAVTVTRGAFRGTGYARCLNKPSCARIAVKNSLNDLMQKETAPDPAAKR